MTKEQLMLELVDRLGSLSKTELEDLYNEYCTTEEKTYLVRMNCEYSISVDATSPDEAVEKANDIDISQWYAAWSSTEVEEE